MNSRTLCFLLLLAGTHAVANAQVFKCKAADGRQVIQGFPCGPGTTDTDPRPAAKPLVLRERDKSPGANWDLGPRPASPSYPSQAAAPTRSAPLLQPRQVATAPQPKQQDATEKLQAAQRKADDEKAAAFNRMQQCNYARQQLGVVKTQRPIYAYDNKGVPQYVKDEDRQATVAAAERRVAEACN